MVSMTKKELATVSGYTYRRLYDIDRDLPDDAKLFVESEDGKYDLALFVQRWVNYKVSNESAGSRDLDEVKAIHERIKTRKTEIQVMSLEGRLVEVSEIRRIWGDIANTAMQNMMRLPSKVAPAVVMMESAEIIAGIIEREVRNILTMIADTPLPDSVADTSDGEAGEV